MFYRDIVDSPLGEITLASSGGRLSGLWFSGQKHFMAKLDPAAELQPDLPIFAETKKWLEAYFSGRNPGPIPPVILEGTPFQHRVWNLLGTIPYGETVTYGQMANRLAEESASGKMSCRAVGGAVGHNPISIILPCHRVVGADGSLTGYAGGIKRKLFLLELEGIDTTRFRIPTKGTAL